MKYPTKEEVEKASHMELGRWKRFLESPGMSATGTVQFKRTLNIERAIMDRICVRFEQFGGWTPQLSKAIGWDKR